MMNNTKTWKKITARSQYSPFVAQGDIGFFHYKNKKYGQFFCVTQTFTKKIFATPIKNLKSESLVEAIDKMLKVKIFNFFFLS
jgi:predicted secreted acid phosphatase